MLRALPFYIASISSESVYIAEGYNKKKYLVMLNGFSTALLNSPLMDFHIRFQPLFYSSRGLNLQKSFLAQTYVTYSRNFSILSLSVRVLHCFIFQSVSSYAYIWRLLRIILDAPNQMPHKTFHYGINVSYVGMIFY